MKKTESLLLIVFLFLLSAARLPAVLIFEGSAIDCRIIDADKRAGDSKISMDFEIVATTDERDSHLFKPGRRFNVEMPLSDIAQKFKIGQLFNADLQAFFDDMGSGRISVTIKPESIKIKAEQGELRDIPFSVREKLAPYLPALKFIFIAFGWFMAFVLCYRSTPVASEASMR